MQSRRSHRMRECVCSLAMLMGGCGTTPSTAEPTPGVLPAGGDDGGSAAGSTGVDSAGGGNSTTGTAAGAAGATAQPAAYANVVAVSATGSSGSYTFSVSVESADIDCTQFADWWEVLSLDGALLYRRILQHSHTDANGTTDADAPGNTFTRTGGSVAIAENETVIVRAHMNTVGYVGQIFRGSVSEGFSLATDLGREFAADVEQAEPLPTDCLF